MIIFYEDFEAMRRHGHESWNSKSFEGNKTYKVMISDNFLWKKFEATRRTNLKIQKIPRKTIRQSNDQLLFLTKISKPCTDTNTNPEIQKVSGKTKHNNDRQSLLSQEIRGHAPTRLLQAQKDSRERRHKRNNDWLSIFPDKTQSHTQRKSWSSSSLCAIFEKEIFLQFFQYIVLIFWNLK